MPPILTVFVEVGLICGVTFWQWRKLLKVRRAEQENLEQESSAALNAQRKFGPLRAFFVFWLNCFGVSTGLWLFNLLASLARWSGFESALNSLGVLTTLAFLLGGGLGVWLFAAWWRSAFERWQADFKRPRPRRRFRVTDTETMPPESRPDETVLDLPPYHELTSPTINSNVKWCDECGRWSSVQHKHGAVAV